MPLDPEAKTPQVPATTAGEVVSKLPFSNGPALTSNAASAKKIVSEAIDLDISFTSS
jgi:hypothetical protein